MREFKYLFGMKPGWRAKFCDEHVVLAHKDNKPVMVKLDTIKEGDVLPRDSDLPLEVA